MPLSYEIDEERKLVITTAWESVTAAEALEHQRQIGNDVRFNPDFSHLQDLTRITAVNIDLTTMNELICQQLFSVKSRRAFVVGGNRLAHGLSRMLIALRIVTGQEQMRVFADRDEALQWLGVVDNR
jgi:hypothetical protein